MSDKPIIKISEKDRINGFPVPNGWHRLPSSDWWVPPGGPWWPKDEKSNG